MSIQTEIEKLKDFVQSHSGEITGLFHDKYERNGGWNGLMDAFNEIQERYDFSYDADEIDSEEFEEIFNNL